MFEHIENLEPIEILQSVSSVRRINHDRPYHAFVFKLSGRSCFEINAKSVIHQPGKLLFLPQGVSYVVEQIEPGQSLVFNFRASLDELPHQFDLGDRVDYGYLCARVRALRVMQTVADRYRCRALFYEILSYICEEKSGYHTDSTMRRMDPAVAYLKEHLFDSDLHIGYLHEKCGMSDTYFRRLFQDRFGQTPKKYVSHQRLLQAKAMIESGECDSMSQVACMCGFDDPLYFSRVYKAQYGHAPTK